MKAIYQGNIRDLVVGADRVLPMIMEEAATGHLMLISEGEQETHQELVYLQSGYVIACSSLMQVSVRNVLITHGLVTPQDVTEAEAIVKQENRPDLLPEHVLIRSGKITMPQVLSAVGSAVKEAVVKAMTSPVGLYIFKPVATVQPQRQLSRLPLADVALSYARQVDDPSSLLPQFASENTVLRLSEQLDQLREQLRFLPQEWKLMFRIDGTRTVGEVRTLMQLPKEEFDRLLFTCLLVRSVLHVEGAASPVDSASATDLVAKALGRTAAVDPSGPRPKRVLIIDDSPTIQEMVQQALSPIDIPLQIELADDGIEGIRRAEENQPDLVILDVVMPGLDGYKTCARLRKMTAPLQIPIIMLTAKDGTFSLIKGKLAGATNYITKPFEPDELRRIVREHLS